MVSSLSSEGFKWLLMVDGSQNAQDGFNIVVTQMYQPGDKVVVSHIYNTNQTGLPLQYRKEYIQEACDQILTAYIPKLSKLFHWTQRDTQSKKSLYEEIANIASLNIVDIIVLGYVGRKGPKADPNKVGSCVDRSIRNIKYNVLVVRNEVSRTPSRGFYWLCCVDPSESSKKGFLLVKKLYKQGDKVKIIYVFNAAKDQEAENTKLKYEKLISQAQIEGSFQKVGMKGGDSKIDTLINFLKQEQPDFVTCGNIGSRKSYQQQNGQWDESKIGSVTESIINLCDSNVLMAVK